MNIQQQKIICIERKYKVESDKLKYIITAKKELSQDITDLLLHEDMELKTFLEYYNIDLIQESTAKIGIDAAKTDIEKIDTEKVDEDTSEHTKLITPIQREWIIVHHMPEEFSLKDIVEFYTNKEENYDLNLLKVRYSSSLQTLKRQGKIKVVNPQDNTSKRRYRKVPEYTEKAIMEGRKALMGTIG